MADVFVCVDFAGCSTEGYFLPIIALRRWSAYYKRIMSTEQ